MEIVAYTSAYSSVKEISMVCSADGTAHSDYVLETCLNREGFQTIPHILTYQEQQMMVVMEGWRPLCWSGKQLVHLARSCPQKLLNSNQRNSSNQEKTISPTTNHAPKPEEGWTQVIRKRKRTIEQTKGAITKAVTTKTKATETPTIEVITEVTTTTKAAVTTPTKSATQLSSSPSKR